MNRPTSIIELHNHVKIDLAVVVTVIHLNCETFVAIIPLDRRLLIYALIGMIVSREGIVVGIEVTL